MWQKQKRWIIGVPAFASAAAAVAVVVVVSAVALDEADAEDSL